MVELANITSLLNSILTSFIPQRAFSSPVSSSVSGGLAHAGDALCTGETYERAKMNMQKKVDVEKYQ